MWCIIFFLLLLGNPKGKQKSWAIYANNKHKLCTMLPLETKKSGGKLLPHSDLRGGGVFLEEVSRSHKRNRDILLGTWNVRSLYRAGALMAAARELPRYKLYLVGVQEVRWENEGTVKAGDYNFFYGKGNENHQLGIGFFCTSQNSISS